MKFFCSGKFFCDVKLKTEDQKIIAAHKVVLSAASPYFHAMFTNFAERYHEGVLMREIDSTALLLLINFIYSGQIVVTEENFQVIIDNIRFHYRKLNYLNFILFIFQGSVTSCKSLAVTRS